MGARYAPAVIEQYIQICPALNFPLPMAEGREGGDDEERPTHPLTPPNIVKHRNRLSGLA